MKKNLLFYAVICMILTQSSQAMWEELSETSVHSIGTFSELSLEDFTQSQDLTPPEYWGEKIEKIMDMEKKEYETFMLFSEKKKAAKKEAEKILMEIEKLGQNMDPQIKEEWQKIKEKVTSWYEKEKVTLKKEIRGLSRIFEITAMNTRTQETIHSKLKELEKDILKQSPYLPHHKTILLSLAPEKSDHTVSHLLKSFLRKLIKKNTEEQIEMIVGKIKELENDMEYHIKQIWTELIRKIKKYKTEETGIEEEMEKVIIEIGKLEHKMGPQIEERTNELKKNLTSWCKNTLSVEQELEEIWKNLKEETDSIYYKKNDIIKGRKWNIKRKFQKYNDSLKKEESFELQAKKQKSLLKTILGIEKNPEGLWIKKEMPQPIDYMILRLKITLYLTQYQSSFFALLVKYSSQERKEEIKKIIEQKGKEYNKEKESERKEQINEMRKIKQKLETKKITQMEAEEYMKEMENMLILNAKIRDKRLESIIAADNLFKALEARKKEIQDDVNQDKEKETSDEIAHKNIIEKKMGFMKKAEEHISDIISIQEKLEKKIILREKEALDLMKKWSEETRNILGMTINNIWMDLREHMKHLTKLEEEKERALCEKMIKNDRISKNSEIQKDIEILKQTQKEKNEKEQEFNEKNEKRKQLDQEMINLRQEIIKLENTTQEMVRELNSKTSQAKISEMEEEKE